MIETSTFTEYRQKGMCEDKNDNICGYKAISEDGDKIGKIHDYILDDQCALRYLVIDAGFWSFGKKILVPVGHVEIRDQNKEVILLGITRDIVHRLPEYREGMPLTKEFETEMMETYYPEETFRQGEQGQIRYDNYEAFTAPKRLQLIEEHLKAATHKEKQGDVRIRKAVDTRMETIELPVTEERIVIEHNPVGAGQQAELDDSRLEFQNEEMTIPLYKEEVEVSKRPVVSEEVTIRKEMETKKHQVQAEVRKERLVTENDQSLPMEERDLTKEPPRGA